MPIDISEAKEAAKFLEKMRNRRRFSISPETQTNYIGWRVDKLTEHFASRYKLSCHQQLAHQFKDELVDRGFDFTRVNAIYEEACTKHNKLNRPGFVGGSNS